MKNLRNITTIIILAVIAMMPALTSAANITSEARDISNFWHKQTGKTIDGLYQVKGIIPTENICSVGLVLLQDPGDDFNAQLQVVPAVIDSALKMMQKKATKYAKSGVVMLINVKVATPYGTYNDICRCRISGDQWTTPCEVIANFSNGKKVAIEIE